MPPLDERLRAILASGRRPSITLFPGAEILMPKRRVGRPRVRDLAKPYAHYKDPRAATRRARCLYCHRRLRVNEISVCGEACADAVFNQALYLWRMIGATREDILQYVKRPTPPTAVEAPVPRQPPSAKRLKAAREAIS